jgi:DNA-binding Xre family transcriptional regulator
MMLIFNPKRILMLRGIDKMFNYLHNHGFIRSTASYLLDGTASHLKIEHIGKLCVILNCTPNDLFEWRTDSNTVLPENHALHAIMKEPQKALNLKKMLEDIPVERLAEVESLLKGLKDG